MAPEAQRRRWAEERERHARKFFYALAREDVGLPPGALTACEIFELLLRRDKHRPKGSVNEEINTALWDAYYAQPPGYDLKARAVPAVQSRLRKQPGFRVPPDEALWTEALKKRLDRLLKAEAARRKHAAEVTALRLRSQ